MKRIIIVFFCISMLTGCTPVVNNARKEEDNKSVIAFVKSIWLTYYELGELTKGKSEKEFTEEINKVFNKIKNIGFNTVTVQVRPCADAFYRSSFFPSSVYCFGKQGAEMPYDPLKIMCASADKADLKIEAWVNPYRVSQDGDTDKLCDVNIAKKWMSDKKKRTNVYVIKNGIYFNPASKDVTKLIVEGVKEIVKNYDVDAIHFDDYFYPSVKKKIDRKEYAEYRKKGGKSSLSEWRRNNVSNMVKSVYKAVKSINKNVKFGISPAANINNDRDCLYADVEKWAREEGYADYLCPQVYFGFKNVYQPFMFTVKKWSYITDCSLYIGLPLYKAGKTDKYAAEKDKTIRNEFKNNNNIIARQITYVSKIDKVRGIYVFSYSSLKDEKAAEEVKNMIKAMQSINRS